MRRSPCLRNASKKWDLQEASNSFKETNNAGRGKGVGDAGREEEKEDDIEEEEDEEFEEEGGEEVLLLLLLLTDASWAALPLNKGEINVE